MKVEIYSKPQCPFCVQAKALAEREGHDLTVKMLDVDFHIDSFCPIPLSMYSLNK